MDDTPTPDSTRLLRWQLASGLTARGLSPDATVVLVLWLTVFVEEAVRAETEACAQDALGTGRMVTDGITRFGRYEDGYARAREDIIQTIRSRLPAEPPDHPRHTAEGESEKQR